MMNNEHELNLRIKQLEDALEESLSILSALNNWEEYDEVIDEFYNVLHGGE